MLLMIRHQIQIRLLTLILEIITGNNGHVCKYICDVPLYSFHLGRRDTDTIDLNHKKEWNNLFHNQIVYGDYSKNIILGAICSSFYMKLCQGLHKQTRSVNTENTVKQKFLKSYNLGVRNNWGCNLVSEDYPIGFFTQWIFLCPKFEKFWQQFIQFTEDFGLPHIVIWVKETPYRSTLRDPREKAEPTIGAGHSKSSQTRLTQWDSYSVRNIENIPTYLKSLFSVKSLVDTTLSALMKSLLCFIILSFNSNHNKNKMKINLKFNLSGKRWSQLLYELL
ncbi:hypothetical protein H8356DRAFT_1327102 [Neocallimastix lanati (nom. inval.)]|nr:hypothetical protein H8356DRAFT_1327102 [Neocallimastix sp. JGI-2020a]